MVRVLFLCTHNSARSQLAEGILRQLAGDRLEVASAGTEARGLHPLAARILRARGRGMDAAKHRSKTVDELAGRQFDWVITVCDSARQECPVFPAAGRRLHWDLADPTAAEGDEAAREAAFAATAEELERRLRGLLPELLRK